MAVYSEIDRKFASASQPAALRAVLCLAFIFLVISGFDAAGQTFTFQQVAAFTSAPDGPAPPANPAGGLLLGMDGNFYGTSFAGGQYGLGTVFQMTSNGVVTVLASFEGTNGANPRGTMVTDNAGNFYGVTYGGGESNAGTVFKISMSGNLTVLHDFYADPGQNPYAGLLVGADGNFYGTTESYSTVFKITPSGVFSNLTSYFGMNGETLNSVLAQGGDGYLYGVAGLKGFSAQGGVAFKLSTSGGSPTIVSQFGSAAGTQLLNSMVPWLGGFYFGSSVFGGANGYGELFAMTNTGGPLFPKNDFNGTWGAYPFAPVVVANGTSGYGYVYGGTAAGGPNGDGVIYSYDLYNTYGPYDVLFAFNGANGSGVYGKLLVEPVAQNANIYYGTTRFGGAYGRGTVFELTPANFTLLTSFPQATSPQPAYSGVIQAADGNFYGITTQVGADNSAAIFQFAPGGEPQLFSVFTNVPNVASDSSLFEDTNGNFYATTFAGGTYNDGTVVKITPDGKPTIIFSFDHIDGANPFAGVIQAADGFLYGTTVNGGGGNGGAGFGTVFRIGTDGSFQGDATLGGTPGAFPYAPLIQGLDGSLYGTCSGGGTNNLGTVFSMSLGGALTGLYSFSGPDGATPYGGLVQGPDAFLYGTTTFGGITNGSSNSAGFGTVFQISTNGAFTTLAYFNGTNGANPRGSLVLGPDGNYYGTTLAGGAANDGTVFSISTGGALTTIYSFSGTDGASPYAGLFFGSDGALYGITTSGGPAGGGNIFRIAQPPVLQLSLVAGQIQLAWPVFDSEFQLQSSSDLNNPNGWTPVTSALSTNSNQVTVSQTAPTNNIFYRLVNP
jgi:uncharacterized repeat protein (TIGR03803 family)